MPQIVPIYLPAETVPSAVSDGRTVYTAQLTAPAQGLPADIHTQTGLVLQRLAAVLQQAHSSPQQILRLELTVPDARCIPAVYAVWQRWSEGCTPPPVWRFGRLPGALVAADAVASVG